MLLTFCPLSRIWLYLFAVYDYCIFSSLWPFSWALLVRFVAIRRMGRFRYIKAWHKSKHKRKRKEREFANFFALFCKWQKFMNNCGSFRFRFFVFILVQTSHFKAPDGSVLFHNQHAQKGNETHPTIRIFFKYVRK